MGGALIASVRVIMNMTRAVCILLVMCSLAGCGIIGGIKKQRATTRIKEATAALKLALDMYFSEYGSFPQGNNERVMAQLLGNNPKPISFLSGLHITTNRIGQLLDPWETPFEIDVSGSFLTVISAGPDGRFGTADDLGRKTMRTP